MSRKTKDREEKIKGKKASKKEALFKTTALDDPPFDAEITVNVSTFVTVVRANLNFPSLRFRPICMR